MPAYDALKKKQTELIRKALDGSVFMADIGRAAIGALTGGTGATYASRVGTAASVNIVTAGNLVLKIDANPNVTVALAVADTPAQQVVKINAAIGATGVASETAGTITIRSNTTGVLSRVEVVSGTGSVIADTKLAVGFTAGTASTVSLTALPTGWDDLGWLSGDGASFSRDVATSEVTSWGSVSPTRSDVTSDTSTLTVVAQETKLLTIGLATGADLAAVLPTAGTGEVAISKPARPSSKFYRVLSLAVDSGDAGEIYVGRFLPRAKVTSYGEQSFGGGDDPISWGVTFTGYEDSTLGYSERWLFGGAGWSSLLTKMGFPAV